MKTFFEPYSLNIKTSLKGNPHRMFFAFIKHETQDSGIERYWCRYLDVSSYKFELFCDLGTASLECRVMCEMLKKNESNCQKHSSSTCLHRKTEQCGLNQWSVFFCKQHFLSRLKRQCEIFATYVADIILHISKNKCYVGLYFIFSWIVGVSSSFCRSVKLTCFSMDVAWCKCFRCCDKRSLAYSQMYLSLIIYSAI